jgi:AcrR family transcriptional regulator
MAIRQPSKTAPAGLSRERIVATAIDVADAEGIAAVSMRRIAQQLGVDPMSLYRHVGTKDGLLDLMIDTVIAGIEPVHPSSRWTDTAREMMLSARRTMLSHPWTAEVIKARPDPTPAALRHLDAVLGVMRDGGLSVDLTHHAIHVLGSRLVGFSQDLYDDSTAPDPDVLAAQARAWAATLPRIAEIALAAVHDGGLGGCDTDEEFAFALDLILDGLDRHARAADDRRS